MARRQHGQATGEPGWNRRDSCSRVFRTRAPERREIHREAAQRLEVDQMATMPSSLSASDASTQLIRAGSRTLAYRTIGEGPEIILCNRFRGTLDTWDPAFLDALAGNFTVITFDYSGIGKSTGEPPSTFAAMAQDAMDLADELMIGSFIIGGWSMGGVAAQAAIATWPELITHAVLIGTNPPGPASRAGEPLFYEVATKPENDLEDEVVLFFEARSAKSRTAAAHSHERIARRHSDVDPPVPPEAFKRILETVGPDIRG